MYQVFNMGHRMEVYVDGREAAEQVMDRARSFGVEARVIGRVEEKKTINGKEGGHYLTIQGPHGTFTYE